MQMRCKQYANHPLPDTPLPVVCFVGGKLTNGRVGGGAEGPSTFPAFTFPLGLLLPQWLSLARRRDTVLYCSSGPAGPGANPGAGALAPPVRPWWIGPVPGGASSNPQEVSDLPQRV